MIQATKPSVPANINTNKKATITQTRILKDEASTDSSCWAATTNALAVAAEGGHGVFGLMQNPAQSYPKGLVCQTCRRGEMAWGFRPHARSSTGDKYPMEAEATCHIQTLTHMAALVLERDGIMEA